MYKTLQSFLELDEDTEINGSGYLTIEDISNLVLLQDLLLLPFIRSFFREDELALFLVSCNYINRNFFAYEFFELAEDKILVSIGHSWIMFRFELGSGQETDNTLPFHYQSTLIGILDSDFVDLARAQRFLRLSPDEGLASFLKR